MKEPFILTCSLNMFIYEAKFNVYVRQQKNSFNELEVDCWQSLSCSQCWGKVVIVRWVITFLCPEFPVTELRTTVTCEHLKSVQIYQELYSPLGDPCRRICSGYFRLSTSLPVAVSIPSLPSSPKSLCSYVVLWFRWFQGVVICVRIYVLCDWQVHCPSFSGRFVRRIKTRTYIPAPLSTLCLIF